MSKKKIGLISLSIVIFIIVVISVPSRSNMVDMREIEEYAETLKEPVKDKEKSLVVMVAPSINEEYYEEVFSEIIEYDIDAVNTIYGKDNVVLLVDEDTKHLFEGQIPDEVIHVSDVADIWIRDFGTVDTITEVKFDYKPQYLENEDSVWIDDSFRDWFDAKNLSSQKSDLILDGGNLVFNGDDKAVTTVRVFADNPQYSESEIDSMLKELLKVTEIAYLPEEEGDITGHSDGMVMWAESDKLLVNEYQEPFRSEVLSELEESFSDIKIVEIPYDLQPELWRDWPSACGYYLNSLVTENHIYVPVYGLEKDQMVLELIQSHTTKKVVSIDASNVCFMGGSVRCLTWTTDGINAEKILES
ncbi:agmatine deiminase family protein [Nitrosopumilus sp.]|uniref:agmatine deiminase family protein n=1 Tax=Nitrosopumilus sp. TaxID=2024843 RepID=UPI00261A4933|nr:agmatine deiminase family protein [Nitrosopumilus sp.]